MLGSHRRDRRKYCRIGTDQVISYAEVGHSDQLGFARDVSRGGIRFDAVGCELELGDLLRITFNLFEQTVVATGRVAWAIETDPLAMEIGLEFVEIDPTAIRWLAEFESEAER